MKKPTMIIFGLILVAAVFFSGYQIGDQSDKPDPWLVALKKGGVVNQPAIPMVLALPSGPISLDSAGIFKINQFVFLKAEDENGEPLVGIYYEVKAVLVNNLPKVDTTESEK